MPENEKFEIVTINPAFIVGPAFVNAGFSSGELVKKIMDNELPGIPRLSLGIVDVRDCADAHLFAIKKKEAAN